MRIRVALALDSARRLKGTTITNQAVDLSEAILLYLKNYPGKNEEEFLSRVDTEAARDAVRAILDETMRIQIVWEGKSLIDIGRDVETVMRERHPQLSTAALEDLGNFFTYLMK